MLFPDSSCVAFVAVAAFPVQEPELPVTLVCNGWTWSVLATVEAVPAEAVPFAFGAVVAYSTCVPWLAAAAPTSS